jgi:hypothetical protein
MTFFGELKKERIKPEENLKPHVVTTTFVDFFLKNNTKLSV